MKRLISTPASGPRTALGKSFWPVPCPTRRYSHQDADTKKASDLTLQMRRRAPLKTIPDTLHPTPCIQFTSLLDDLVPNLAHHHSNGSSGRQAPVVLPQGAHLVYFPPLQPASQLAPDGADADHVPPDFGPLATTWHGSSDGTSGGGGEGGRRLWAGGEVTFRDGWQREAVADGRAWVCREEIAGARALGGGRRVVDVVRRYGPGGMAFVEERRTLAFVPGPGDGGEEAPRNRMMKRECFFFLPFFLSFLFTFFSLLLPPPNLCINFNTPPFFPVSFPFLIRPCPFFFFSSSKTLPPFLVIFTCVTTKELG